MFMDTSNYSKKYNLVKCTVEWYQHKGNDNVNILDSRCSYQEVRQKAPHLLCDFFERHIEFYDQQSSKTI